VIIGGINWLLVGLADFDLVASLFGGRDSPLATLIYVLVEISALWQLIPFSGRLHLARHGRRPTYGHTGDVNSERSVFRGRLCRPNLFSHAGALLPGIFLATRSHACLALPETRQSAVAALDSVVLALPPLPYPAYPERRDVDADM
jgi:uncharacterized protein